MLRSFDNSQKIPTSQRVAPTPDNRPLTTFPSGPHVIELANPQAEVGAVYEAVAVEVGGQAAAPSRAGTGGFKCAVGVHYRGSVERGAVINRAKIEWNIVLHPLFEGWIVARFPH